MQSRFTVILLFVFLIHASHPTAAQTPVQQTGTKIILLGTGTPNANPERSGPATAILVNGIPYLVDFGPGVIRRAAAAGIPPRTIRHAFATHLHSDHTVGLPDIIFSAWTLEREVPLELYGPPGIKAMAENIHKAWGQDIDIRINGLEPANTEGYKVNAHDVLPGLVYEDENVKVTAFQIDHGNWEHAYGYRFETADRTIVISGDTTYSKNLIHHAQGADVLIHEAYYTEGLKRRRPEWQRYHSAFHTSAVDVGRAAAEADVGMVLLTHVLWMGGTEEQLVAEVKQNYDGKVIAGKDLGVY
jgi:ribonuclease Z